MPEFDFKAYALTQTFENQTHLVKVLRYPELSLFGTKLPRLYAALAKGAAKVLAETYPVQFAERDVTAKPEVIETEISVEPPAASVAWTKPLELRFHVIQWSHAERVHIARVPALDIEVLANDREKLPDLVASHIRFALMRTGANRSLWELVLLQRCKKLRVRPLRLTARIPTPKRTVMGRTRSEQDDKSVLTAVASDLVAEPPPQAFEIDDVVKRLADALTGRRPGSVLLVGASGVGKTAAVHELARQRSSHSLGQTPFWETSGARLVAGMSGYGMWEERCQQLCREAAKRRIILVLGNLVELMHVGKSEHGAQGIAGFLAPRIASGELLAIAECTPQQLSVIEREEPRLVQAFRELRIDEPSADRIRSILLSCALNTTRDATPVDETAIEEIDRLHRRYATYSAHPGRPLRFLHNLLKDYPGDSTVRREDVIAAFARETGLPRFMLDDSVAFDAPTTRDWFARRVIGQPAAVEVVSDVLAMAKARLARPHKPLGSLLFMGPTGVGKTEMAKALAEFLFGDRTRMARFDMSEYADPMAVERLVGDRSGAEGTLTAKVRENAFSVLLLDEFEKAHPAFFDLLLQVLGEGRLTDAAGRVADFSACMVVMTSNLGAASFQRGPFGFARSTNLDEAQRQHFLEAVRSFLRPELFNRIDRVVPFSPLTRDVVKEITRRELALIRRRNGVVARDMELTFTGEAIDLLVEHGYDPAYGARPLKRTLEREVITPLADAANSYSWDHALRALVHVANGSVAVRVGARTGSSGQQVWATASRGRQARLADEYARLRRALGRFKRHPVMHQAENELYKLKLQARRGKAQHTRARVRTAPARDRQQRLGAILKGLKALTKRVHDLEEQALLAIYEARENGGGGEDEIDVLRKTWNRTLLSFHALPFKHPNRVTIGVYGEEPAWMCALARLYYEVAVEMGADLRAVKFILIKGSPGGQPPGNRPRVETRAPIVHRQAVRKPREFLRRPEPRVIGIALEILAPFAAPRFDLENGIHRFQQGDAVHRCLVHAEPLDLAEYRPPPDIGRRGAIGRGMPRRLYHADPWYLLNLLPNKRFPWSTQGLADAIEWRLRLELERLTEP
jgi:ATP-dependent Clp protease ATP-binding subunit ClpC